MSSDEKTRVTGAPGKPPWQDNPSTSPGERTGDPHARTSTGGATGGGNDKFDGRTIILNSGQRVGGGPGGGGAHDGRTRVFDDGRLPKGRDGQTEQAMERPVVGWLAVTSGPGVGAIFTLEYGNNTVARGAEAKIRLNFGDAQISEKTCFIITYEGKSRKFFARPGEGASLAYLNEQAVMSAMDLEPFTEIKIGATVLRFVPLCGPGFDWQDTMQS